MLGKTCTEFENLETPEGFLLMEEYYINKKIQGYIDNLIELFCLQDNIPKVYLRPNKDNMSGYCTHFTSKTNSEITVGCRGGLRLTTLVHEFLHAAGFPHTDEINDFANFRTSHDDPKYRYKDGQRQHSRDTYSPLIVKDLCGKKELIL